MSDDLKRALQRHAPVPRSELDVTVVLRQGDRRRRRRLALYSIASICMLVIGGVTVSRFPEATNRSGRLNPAISPSAEPSSPQPSEGSEAKRGKNEPPLVTVSSSTESIELSAWSYCFGNRCASGSPPPNPPDIGSPDEVFVEFPLEGWSFDAYFSPSGQRCGRVQKAAIEEAEDGRFVLRPVGYADTYDVTLFGDGGGSLSVTFRWTTTTDGPLPEPEARTAILSGNPNDPESYGVELGIDNLAETPKRASARITVEDAEGGAITFKAKRAKALCRPEGTLYWDGPDHMGQRATELGEGPYRYTVEVILDGERYRAEAVWPDDEIKGNEPSVSLDFSPELPRLR